MHGFESRPDFNPKRENSVAIEEYLTETQLFTLNCCGLAKKLYDPLGIGS